MDPKQLERELDDIERSIALLKRDFEIYFAGAAKLPPTDSRNKLDKAIKRYATIQGLSYALRFRYNSLASRFNSYQDLWTKQLRLKEEGRPITGVSSPPPVLDRKSRQKGDGQSDSGAIPKIDPLELLFRDYVTARQQNGESTNLRLENFKETLLKQKESIQQKFGARDVEFYVAVEGGKTKLKAKTVK